MSERGWTLTGDDFDHASAILENRHVTKKREKIPHNSMQSRNWYGLADQSKAPSSAGAYDRKSAPDRGE